MSFSQSRVSSRGPLIAVIKIELQENKIDRIFLHQNDDDYTLAVEFVNKHSINKSIINHIYQRIKMSREAVQNQYSQRSLNNAHRQTGQFNQFQSSQTRRLDLTPNQRRQLSQISPVVRKQSNFQKTDYSPSYRNPVPLVHQKKQQQKHSNYQKAKIPKENKVYYQHTNNITNKTKQDKQNLQNERQRQRNEYNQNEFIMYSDSSQKKNTQNSQHNNNMNMVSSSNKKNDQFLTEQYHQFSYGNMNNNSIQQNKFENYPVFKKNAQSSSHQEKQYESQSSEGLFQKNTQLKQSKNLKQKNQYEKFVNINKLQRKENKDIFGSIGHLKKKQRNSPQSKITQFYERSEHQDSPLFNQSNRIEDNIKNMTKKQQQQIYQKQVQDFPYSYISFSGKKPETNNNKDTKQKIQQNQLKKKQNLNAKQNIESTQRVMNSTNFHEIASSNSKRFQHQSQKQKDNTLQSGQIFHNRNNINFSARQKQKQDTDKTVRYTNNYSNTKKQQKQSQYKQHQPQQVLSLFEKTQRTIKINPTQNDQDNFNRPSRVKILNKQEIMSLKQSHLNRSLSKSQIKKINQEVTSRLYNQTQIKKKYLHAIKSRAKQLQDQEDLESQELTHKPQINAVSKALAEGRRQKPLEQHLMEQGKLLEIKRQESVSKFAKKQLQKCSFKPQINPISQRLANSRSRSRINSSIKQSKCQKNIQNANKFKPQINSLSYQLIKNKGGFFQRQKAYLQQKNSKLFQLIQQKRFDQKRDKISGQNLFKPNIKDSKVVKIQRNKDVYQYLYSLSKKVNQKPKSPHKPIINSKSQRLVEQMQEKRLTWIFSQLDSDNDGVISARKICVDFIPQQILLIIAPVLYEMQEINQSLNLQQFKNAVTILQKTLDPNRKNILFNYRKGGQCQVQLTSY